MKRDPEITVVIATCNNSRALQRTLEGFSNTNRREVDVEIVVVNNNSTDSTRAVVKSFDGQLPIRYLHEARQGKCAALNRALNDVEFGPLVFFTDDDVDVPEDLFLEIVDCSERNSGSRVFGGHVHLVWPPTRVPEWAKELARSYKGYSQIDLGPQERPFPPKQAPMGTNWWIRREVLERGYRFDERIGPGSTRCGMGDETAFLLQLAQEGEAILYAPTVRIGHRVPERLLSERAIRRRAFEAGTAGAVLAYEYGFGPRRWVKNEVGWRLTRRLGLVRSLMRYVAAFASLSRTRRVIRQWNAMQGIGWNLEALRITSGTRPSEGAPGTSRRTTNGTGAERSCAG